MFEKSLQYEKDDFACFVDLEMANNRVPRNKLWRVLQEYGTDVQSVDGRYVTLLATYSLCSCEWLKSRSFHVSVGLRQVCVMSPLFFIIYTNWVDKLSRTDECLTIRRCMISRLFIANDLILLVSSESDLEYVLNGSAASHDIAGMKISTTKLRL